MTLREAAALAFEGLLHDATEAYLNDISTPVKHSPDLAGYRAAEERVRLAVVERFGLPREESALVKWADKAVLVNEGRDLMPPSEGWEKRGKPIEGLTVVPLPPVEARAEWISRFSLLRRWL